MPLAIPNTTAELEDMLSDQTKMTAVAAEEGGLLGFMKAYADARMKNDPGLVAQVKEETKRVFNEMLEASGLNGAKGKLKSPIPLNMPGENAMRDRRHQLQRNRLYNKRAAGAPLDNSFEDLNDFLQTSWHLREELPDGKDRAVAARKAKELQNSFGSLVPADGGFLIPEQFRSDLLQWSLETAVVRPRATIIPMSTLRVNIPMVDSTSNVGSVFGGVIAYWSEEGASITESQASFGQVTLDAHKLTAYAAIPNELIADANAFPAFVDKAFPSAIGYYEDYAFMRGTGTGEPLGFINCPASIAVAAFPGQPVNSIVWENVIAMYARMMPTSLGSAVWLVTPDAFPQLATMALSVGTGGAPVWINDGTQTPRLSLLGRPIYITEKIPTLGTTGDIAFVDLNYYLIGDRQAMMAASSTEFLFGSDKTAYRFIQRLDGRPWVQSAITPKNGGPTLSPFVQLVGR